MGGGRWRRGEGGGRGGSEVLRRVHKPDRALWHTGRWRVWGLRKKMGVNE